MISDFSMWLGGKDASICVGKSREWIEIKALEWPLDNKPVEGRIRFQWLRDKPSDLGVRRYYRPDLDAIQRWSTFVTQGRPVGFKQVEPCDPFMNTNNAVWLGAKLVFYSTKTNVIDYQRLTEATNGLGTTFPLSWVFGSFLLP
jgi:hypothetical protein